MLEKHIALGSYLFLSWPLRPLRSRLVCISKSIASIWPTGNFRSIIFSSIFLTSQSFKFLPMTFNITYQGVSNIFLAWVQGLPQWTVALVVSDVFVDAPLTQGLDHHRQMATDGVLDDCLFIRGAVGIVVLQVTHGITNHMWYHKPHVESQTTCGITKFVESQTAQNQVHQIPTRTHIFYFSIFNKPHSS